MALTQESILSFLLEHGGKVKNTELLNSFRSQINCSDPAEKLHNRDLFKKLVNSVAVVKQIDEAKFVVVKKRYQDFVKEGVHDAPQKTQMDDSFSSPNTSFSYTSPHRAEAASVIHSDIENNNMSYPLNINCNYFGDAKHMPGGSVQKRRPLSRNISSADTTTVKVLNISGDHTSRAGKSGAVFAVISVKSPPRNSAPAPQDGLHSQVHQHKTSDTPITLGTKVSTSSVQTLNSNFPACQKDESSEHQCRESRQTENMQLPGFPQVRPQNKTTKQADDAKYSESVPLEPLAHEWLVKCAAGLWSQIYALLLQDTRLAQRKDFMSGFTALHWAAKEGNCEMIHKLMDISRQRGTYININSKAHGGYTPLHIAAIHGHTEVMLLLVQRYGANVNERDNAGKKAFHYLGKGLSAEMRALLGGLQQIKYREKTDEEDYREHPKGFNTISKLFQPHIGKKQRTTTKFTHDW
ncbi:ankyrin repeat domain-containing protein SOWAHB-like [Seriola dumerili]|uniref:ankyrin repeat domain-containing protein SOWAHB-like n=1 Tax=Seriola dumerili TaxID=41447 RepID=UPI000BBEE01C|nr:ankyrin repeat domain-containing protein SOWAHB-like [Seriola dumerili]